MATYTLFQMAARNSNSLGSYASMKPNKNTRITKNLGWKGIGLLFTIALAVSAIVPDLVNVPTTWRPWLFVIFIFWFIFYVSGMFTL